MSNAEYLKALKREADRERVWRMTRQGAFESSFGSLDEFTARFDDPGKVAVFSDGGRGVEAVFAGHVERDRKNLIAAALERLAPGERAFARAVLRGATWRELGLTRQGFNWKLRELERKLSK